MKRLWVFLLAVCTVLSLGLGSSAQADTVALSLVLDGSGSITASNWSYMLNSYASAITDPNVLPQDSSVALNVIQFSSGGYPYTSGYANEEVAFTLIDSQATADAFATALLGISQVGYNTCISCGIYLASSTLQPLMGSYDRYVIDVATDGDYNVGNNPYDAALAVVTNDGITAVNSLGIGVDAIFNYGTDSFNARIDTFAQFEQAIKDKIIRETQAVPEPATMLLLGAGLLGVGLARRRLRS